MCDWAAHTKYKISSRDVHETFRLSDKNKEIKLDMRLTLKALIAYQIMLVLRKLNNCSRTGQISDE